MMIRLKETISNRYNAFLVNRHRVVRLLLPTMLVTVLIIGAGYRSIVIIENYEERPDLGVFFSLASNFKKTFGAYSHDEYLDIVKNPDEYVYAKGKSKFNPSGSIENELGWSLILSVILKDGVKGVHNLALIIARYQTMIDLSIIIILFWAGKRVAGSVGACLAPLLYSIFKMPMVVMSWVSYYYWTIPFSAISLLFWTVLYKPEDDKNKKYLSFFFYGAFMGFATFVRLYFLFLPLFLSPLIFIREKALKKGLILCLIMFLGQSFLLIPQVLLTKKHHGAYALTTRGSWHLVVQGLGIYPNPWGIKDSGDVTVVQWAIDRGGPDLNKEGVKGAEAFKAYNEFLKNEVIKMFKERPDIFLRNFKNNMIGGMTISTHFFQFFGIIDTVPSMLNLFKVFPWLILSSYFLLFIFSRNQFWIASAVFLQGLYLLLVVCTFFPSYIPFVAGYIPVFVALLAIATAVYIKTFFAFMEGCVRCRVQGGGIKTLPAMIIECYRDDWSIEQYPIGKQYQPNRENTFHVTSVQTIMPKIRWRYPSIKLLTVGGAILLIAGISVGVVYKYKNGQLAKAMRLSPAPYVTWNMDTDTKDEIADLKGGHKATSFNTGITEGHSGNARYFNGKVSYIKTPVSFQGWKAITISFWVKPEHKEGNELSVILDNGHDAHNNFAIQSADSSGGKWVWHCNGMDIFLNLALNKWNNVVVTVDAEKGIIKAYANDVKAGEVKTNTGFVFGSTPLTIGKLAKGDERYFKGSIDEVTIWDKVVETGIR